MRIVVGISGATGAPIGVRILELLHDLGVETHLVMTKWARVTLELETDRTVRDVRALATHVHSPDDQAAVISSGSFHTDGMVVAPCSMKSVAGIRLGYGENLLLRAADVTLKERRPLVLVPRETPLTPVHLENLLHLVRQGVHVVPPMPAFYNRPASVADIVDHIAVRTLDQLGLDVEHSGRWTGMPPAGERDLLRKGGSDDGR